MATIKTFEGLAGKVEVRSVHEGRVEAQFPDGSKAVLEIDERGEMFISTPPDTSAAAFMARITRRGEATGDGEATEADKALFDRMKAALDKIESE